MGDATLHLLTITHRDRIASSTDWTTDTEVAKLRYSRRCGRNWFTVSDNSEVVVKAFLGIKFEGHDTAAFLLVPHTQGLYGVATERLTRRKHDRLIPLRAILELSTSAKTDLCDVDELVCANCFSSHRDRLFKSSQYFDELIRRGMEPLDAERSFAISAPSLETVESAIRRAIGVSFPGKRLQFRHFDHEYCHARSAFHFSPFRQALVLTLDGSGDYGVFSRVYLTNGQEFSQIAFSASDFRIVSARTENSFSKPASIGGLYSYFTHLLGYEPNCEEGKVEALAAYGQPIARVLVALEKACGISTDERQIHMYPSAMAELVSMHEYGVQESQRADIAATIQFFLEKIVVEYVALLLRATGARALCLSGGVFANVLLNMKLARLVKNEIYIAPAMGDDGSAQGAAIAALVEDDPQANLTWVADQRMPYFGLSYTVEHAKMVLRRHSAQCSTEQTSANWPAEIASRVARGQVGAIFQGRAEFGPRALGNRSIVASPLDARIRDRINSEIKRRPVFQPVCPAILIDERERLFEDAYANSHMTCAFIMKPEHRRALAGAIHIDGTSRVQFVDHTANAFLYAILLHLREMTGFGVMLNTSFNMHGRAIVATPEHALRDFLDAGLDFLYIEGLLITPAGLNKVLEQ